MTTSTYTASGLLALQRDACGNRAIEWDEVPLLADPLGQRWVELAELRRAFAAAEPRLPLVPFGEGLQGVSVRVLDQPEVFAHYFGR